VCGKLRNAKKFAVIKVRGKTQLGTLGIDERIMLK
jgi:hypothetical protein